MGAGPSSPSSSLRARLSTGSGSRCRRTRPRCPPAACRAPWTSSCGSRRSRRCAAVLTRDGSRREAGESAGSDDAAAGGQDGAWPF
eukprot:363866-Chlamydomonas_euryale.AAC.10